MASKTLQDVVDILEGRIIMTYSIMMDVNVDDDNIVDVDVDDIVELIKNG